MADLEAGLRGQYVPPAPVAPAAAAPAAPAEAAAPDAEQNQAPALDASAQAAPEIIADETPAQDAAVEGEQTAADEPAAETPADTAAPAPAAPPPKPAKPVVAMRGDDRPGMRKAEAAPAGRGGKFGDRKDARPGGGKPDGRGNRPADNKFEPYRPERESRFSDRPAYEERGPRLGDAAFRAQREAFEHAQQALRKLSEQAHGEVLTNLLTAWEKRDPALVPDASALGKLVTPAARNAWTQALSSAPKGEAADTLLRLEIAAELPTPAEHLSARRMLQLVLLTKRNDPAPAQTWGEDTAKVLAAPYDAAHVRRLQNVLKALIKR
jgi:hypothetical protein